jgi:CTP synthase
MLLCRSDRPLPKELKDKIGLFCNLPGDHVFTAIDVSSIYEVPLYFKEEGLDEKIAEKLGIWTSKPDLSKWKAMVEKIRKPKGEVTIGIVGKYVDWKDSYKSLAEALTHGGVANDVRVNAVYIDSEEIEKGNLDALRSVDGVLVPGGFGDRGVEGKIKAIEYARTEGVPFFGICLGLQVAVIEFARHVAGIKDASSAEFTPKGKSNVIDIMESQKSVKDLGGTMRLGAYPCQVLAKHAGKATKAFIAYGKDQISERHRHRFEVSNHFRPQLEEKGLLVSGKYKDKASGMELVEMIELPWHPYFLGCQFHPELQSQPLKPHPLFSSFIKAAKELGKSTQRSLPGIKASTGTSKGGSSRSKAGKARTEATFEGLA